MRYLLLFILLLPFNFIVAQIKTITGTIIDVNSEKLVGVNIYLSSDKNIGTVSDLNGEFVLETSMEYPFRIEISGVGYEKSSFFIRSSNDQILDVILEESILFGEEVVVSASLFEQNILTAPVSIEKLNILDIEQ